MTYELDLINRLSVALNEARATVAEIEDARRSWVLADYDRAEAERLRAENRELRALVDRQARALAAGPAYLEDMVAWAMERASGTAGTWRSVYDEIVKRQAAALRGTTSNEEAGASVPPAAEPVPPPAEAPASSGDLP